MTFEMFVIQSPSPRWLREIPSDEDPANYVQIATIWLCNSYVEVFVVDPTDLERISTYARKNKVDPKYYFILKSKFGEALNSRGWERDTHTYLELNEDGKLIPLNDLERRMML